MAAAPYWAITQAIKAQLDTKLATQSPVPRVVAEEAFTIAESWVGIYCRSRAAPQEYQALAAGTLTRFLVRFELYCWRFAMSAAKASELRDGLVGATELALMSDPSFAGNCTSSWLEGGTMLTQEDPQSLGRFFAGGQIVLIVDTQARTT